MSFGVAAVSNLVQAFLVSPFSLSLVSPAYVVRVAHAVGLISTVFLGWYPMSGTAALVVSVGVSL